MQCSGNSKLNCTLALVVALHVAGCSREIYADRDIEAGRTSTLESLTNVHASSLTYIKVIGKRYERVRGDAPFFLRVSGENSIIFVTQNKDGSEAWLHIVRLDRREDIKVDLGDSIFGSGIQSASKPGEYCDWIQSSTPSELVVVCRGRRSARSARPAAPA